jgi:hypothetical protein
VNHSSELSRDRKGTFTSFCEQCWEKYTGEKRKREQEIEQTLASRKKKSGRDDEVCEVCSNPLWYMNCDMRRDGGSPGTLTGRKSPGITCGH